MRGIVRRLSAAACVSINGGGSDQRRGTVLMVLLGAGIDHGEEDTELALR